VADALAQAQASRQLGIVPMGGSNDSLETRKMQSTANLIGRSVPAFFETRLTRPPESSK
jgi:hypothetical protein